MNKQSRLLQIVIIALLAFAMVGPSQAQGRAPQVQVENGAASPAATGDRTITYQGRLTKDGVPVDGNCDFKFSLWDAETSGHQIGVPVYHVDAVKHGLYTTEFNTADSFGDIPFVGGPRYLQIELTCPSDGSGVYTKLIPRQRLNAVPYAQSLIPGAAIVNTNAAGTPATHGLWVESQNGFGVLGRAEEWEGVIGESGTGAGVRGTSTSGIAVWATGSGVISSTADSELYLSPWELKERPDTASLTGITLGNDGYVTLHNDSGTGERYFMLPVQIPGKLFGAPLYVKSVKVCYKTSTPATPVGYITATAMGKNSGVGTGLRWYFIDGTDHNLASECYVSTANTPRVAVDGPSWVQFNVQATGTGNMLEIYDIVLTLSEMRN